MTGAGVPDRRQKQQIRAPGRRSSDLSWAAAVAESEGCLRLTNTTANLGVTNTDRRILYRLNAIFGAGTVRMCGHTGTRPVYRWDLFGDKALDALRRIRPYLASKGEQADLLLTYKAGRRGVPITEAERARRATIRSQLSAYKRHPDE